MSDHLPVTVSVPIDRLADFHQMFGKWLSAQEAPPDTDRTSAASWAASNETTAIAFYRAVSPKAAKILDCWMDADEDVDAHATAAAAGLDGPYGVAGSLSSVGKAAAKLHVELPFHHTPGGNGQVARYRMLAAARPLFQAARKAVRAR